MIFKFYISIAIAVIICQLFVIQRSGRENTENTVFSQAEKQVLQQVQGSVRDTSISQPIELQNLLKNKFKK